MDSNATLDPVAMASTISRARLEALASLHQGDYDTFLTLGKHCIDAHAQATKAMMDDVGQRINSGENFDWRKEIDGLKDGLYKYCQAIVEEAECLVPEPLNCSDTFKATGYPISIKTTIDSHKSSFDMSSTTHNRSERSVESTKTPVSIDMPRNSGNSHLVSVNSTFGLKNLMFAPLGKHH